jgi:hypothetical protein
MIEVNKDQKELARKLADSISTGNINHVHDLLDDEGEFTISDSTLEFAITDKYGFLNWLKPFLMERNLSSVNKIDYTIDQCLFCKIGNPVIIFEDGKFPINTKEPWQREKLGFMLEFEGEKISAISICGVFLHADNPLNIEIHCSRY